MVGARPWWPAEFDAGRAVRGSRPRATYVRQPQIADRTLWWQQGKPPLPPSSTRAATQKKKPSRQHRKIVPCISASQALFAAIYAPTALPRCLYVMYTNGVDSAAVVQLNQTYHLAAAALRNTSACWVVRAPGPPDTSHALFTCFYKGDLRAC